MDSIEGARTSLRPLHVACLVLLLVTAARLFALDVGELNRLRAIRTSNEMMPRFGSLFGIDPKGKLVQADFARFSHVLMFVIHSERAAEEVAYWNGVVAGLGNSSSIDYWGICNAGAACNELQSSAHFRILGFLDSYQMHIIGNADSRSEALLYDNKQTVTVTLARVASPQEMANAISKAAIRKAAK